MDCIRFLMYLSALNFLNDSDAGDMIAPPIYF